MANEQKVWEKLPDDLLEKVLSNIPFPNLLNLRTVSKRWNSVIIPNAARRGQVVCKAGLLYFDDRLHLDGSRLFWKRWLKFRVDKLESEWSTWQEFEPRTFPVPRGKEILQLVGTDGGLLCFTCKMYATRLEFLVCNPLTGQYKILVPPAPVRPRVLAGIAIDSETGTYKLVVAGVEDANPGEPHTTFVYDSLSCSWKTKYSSSHIVDKRRCQLFIPKRSICFKGNLYFFVDFMGKGHTSVSKAVFKYDPRNELWSKVQERVEYPLDFGASRISSEEGDVLFMDGHGRRKFQLQKLDRVTGMKLMSEDKLIENFLEKDFDVFDYCGFRQNDMLYHVIHFRTPCGRHYVAQQTGGVVIIIIQNTSDGTHKYFYAEGSLINDFNVNYVWAFSPSLSAVA